MDSEYEILSHLEKNQDTSQRKIAGRTGLSVGTVNLLLKKMVRKGIARSQRLKDGSNVSNTPINCDRTKCLLVITWTAETVGELEFTETVNILNVM